jgi:hypothetical protein
MGMIFRTDDYSYLSTNMVNAITMQEVSKHADNLHAGVSWRAILPKLVGLLHLSPDGTRASTGSDEATIVPATAKKGRMGMPCKLICAEVLSNLAKDNVRSFDEVQSQQWDELARSAMGAVNTEAREWQFETHWLNLDVVGPKDGFEKQPQGPFPEQLSGILLAPTNRSGQKYCAAFQKGESCANKEPCPWGHHRCAAVVRQGRTCHMKHAGAYCWNPKGSLASKHHC